MLDWKAHALHGKSFHVLRGPILIPLVLAIAAVTAASFFLNAVFGFCDSPAQLLPRCDPRSHARVLTTPDILLPGGVVGLLVGFSAFGRHALGAPVVCDLVGAVVGVLMICYVAVPARLIGVKPVHTRREKLTIGVVGGAMGTVVSRRHISLVDSPS